ncbi:MAG: hypothetical protein ABEJ57_03295 [Halobacteriaceae archaeon]
MYETREALAAVLGIAAGLLFVTYPGLVLRVQTAGTRPDRQPGPTGQTPELGGVWYWLIRGIGAVMLVGGLYFAARPWVG